MTDKNPQKLAAARRMLKEYQKKSRESTPTQSLQLHQVQDNTEISSPFKREDVKSNNSSAQNYVYDSGTSGIGNTIESSVKNQPVQSKSLVNGDSNNYVDKSNEHYVNQLVSELRSQQLFTENALSTSSTSSSNDSSTNAIESNFDIKSAKDFFNSLPVSTQSSVDFSFDGRSTTDISSAFALNPNLNSTVVTDTVPEEPAQSVPSSFVDGANSSFKNTLFNINTNSNDSQSEQSESVPLTPSEHDKSDDISSSSVGQSPKHVSKVLELQLKEVDAKLGIEINKNNVISEQLQQSLNHISQLEERMETASKESDAKIAALEEKLQLHAKTLEILVSEKTELQSTLTICQESISQKAGEIEELQCKLRASRHRVGDLERELCLAQALRQQQEKAAHEATLSRDMLKKEVDLMRKHLDESTEEVLDLKHKLQEKCKEISSLNDDLKEKDSQMSVLQLRIDQLRISEDGVSGQTQSQDIINSLQNDKKTLEQQIEQLNLNLKNLTCEKDEASLQYQQYVTSLNTQLQAMAAKYEALSNHCDSLTTREASLVEHIASLEKQMQQSMPRKQSPPPTTAAICSLQQQNTELLQFKQQFEDVSVEKKQLEEQLSLRKNETEKLNAALEAYSLRVLDLERHVERLEVDRPDANLLQAAIESDKVAASRAIAQNTDLKKQLEELQDAFIKMSDNKLELTEKLQLEQNHCKELSKQLAKVNEANAIVEHEEKHKEVEKMDFCSQTYNIKDVDISDITIDLEAMAKLEDKFKRKMQEVAELSDEKQRLEHLVLQLQGETETIGEYIALYQIQRGMLRQKAQEKDEQMARLSQEREVLRNKLNELNYLVTTLLPDSHNHHHDVTPVGNGMPSKEVELAQETETETQHSNCSVHTVKISEKPVSLNKEETAGKIRSLLTEIGSSKLVTSDSDAPNFHPCLVCSGRLITV